MGQRTTAELKKFYRSVVHSDAPLADRMRAAARLQKLYDAEKDQKPTPAPKPMTVDDARAAIAAVTKGNANAQA